ncbi:MAG: acylphosphatase [Candidatus Peregrinibacteria bacterium]|nr:acylphosphatase [Candidatus Peregrinibacteria bacterium]
MSSSSPKQATLLISGKVQGVFFRAHAAEEAARLTLNGYARNLPEGHVEALVQGPEENIQSFIEWAKKGSPSAKVEKVEVVWEELSSPSSFTTTSIPTAKIYQDFRIY